MAPSVCTVKQASGPGGRGRNGVCNANSRAELSAPAALTSDRSLPSRRPAGASAYLCAPSSGCQPDTRGRPRLSLPGPRSPPSSCPGSSERRARRPQSATSCPRSTVGRTPRATRSTSWSRLWKPSTGIRLSSSPPESGPRGQPPKTTVPGHHQPLGAAPRLSPLRQPARQPAEHGLLHPLWDLLAV